MNKNTYVNIFNNLAKYSADDKMLNEIAGLLKDQLNEDFKTDAENSPLCRRIFLSRNSGEDSFIISVIPVKPASKILGTKFLSEYEIDINTSAFSYGKEYDNNLLNAEEGVAWLLHELFANIMTDETFTRFKKMIVNHYDTRNKNVLGAMDTYGMLTWIDVFSRTKKNYTFRELSEVNALLKEKGLDTEWNSALLKFISANGGDERVISETTLNDKDKASFTIFNALARKYASNHMQYNNTEYDTNIRYYASTTNSELVRYYLKREPLVTPTHMEKETFLLFDDNRLLYESACSDDGCIKATMLGDKLDELKKELPYIHSAYDKIVYDAKLKELDTFIDDKIENTVGDTEYYDNLKFDLDGLDKKAEEADVNLSVSVRELE